MSDYIVTALKYRPDSFETLIGQDGIAQTLKNSILRDQLAHAYLFCGPRGVGKTSTARIFAKTINCAHPGPNMEPCGECESCVAFKEGRSYCIHELDAASNNGVDDIKTLMEKVQIPPQVGKYSVYIIDEVHMLSQAAFNAFLKTLEEPPRHAIFILATTEKHKILPTILSRCQTYDFNRISVPDIVRNLRGIASKEGIRVDDESLHVIAQKADGAMRDALTIFDQTVAFCGTDIHYEDVKRNLNVLDYEYGFELVDAFLAGDHGTALLKFDEILSKGFNALYFMSSLSAHLRDLAVCRTGGLDALLELPDSLKARYRAQAERCPMAFLYNCLDIATRCEMDYRSAVNPRLHIEFALMKMAFLLKAPSARPSAEAPAVAEKKENAPSGAPADSGAPKAAASAPAAPETPASSAGGAADSASLRDPVRANAPSAAPSARPSAEAPSPVPAEAPAVAEKKENAPSGVPADSGAPKAVAPAPATPASTESPAPAPAKPKGRGKSSLSMSAVLESGAAKTAAAAETAVNDAPAPDDESILAKWKDLADEYKDRPRLHTALSTSQLSITPVEDCKEVCFAVFNEAQKTWLEENILHKLEGRFQQMLGSGKVRLVIRVVAPDQVEKVNYLPSDRLREKIERDPRVGELVKDLGLEP